MLTVQFLPSGNPEPHTRQLLATWVLKAWDMVPVELARNPWTAHGYPQKDMLGTTDKKTIVPYSPEQTSTLVERICGPD